MKTAKAIKETIASCEEYNSITINNVNSSLFKNEFVPMVARYLNGKVICEDNDIINYRDGLPSKLIIIKRLWFLLNVLKQKKIKNK